MDANHCKHEVLIFSSKGCWNCVIEESEALAAENAQPRAELKVAKDRVEDLEAGRAELLDRTCTLHTFETRLDSAKRRAEAAEASAAQLRDLLEKAEGALSEAVTVMRAEATEKRLMCEPFHHETALSDRWGSVLSAITKKTARSET